MIDSVSIPQGVFGPFIVYLGIVFSSEFLGSGHISQNKIAFRFATKSWNNDLFPLLLDSLLLQITSYPILPGLKIAFASVPTTATLKFSGLMFNTQYTLNPPIRFSITAAANDMNNPANKLLYCRLL